MFIIFFSRKHYLVHKSWTGSFISKHLVRSEPFESGRNLSVIIHLRTPLQEPSQVDCIVIGRTGAGIEMQKAYDEYEYMARCVA